jgi:hypothetical protein
MRFTRLANVVLGIWLILSPFILGYNSSSAIWNSIIVGFLVMVFAYISNREVEIPGERI